ncbi:hypothetical protein E4U17_007761 [Claviceps sp. LM77 group G4]|nr:hypothetical protein E4U17_007761 [Claviceps sp. LM77 group G4]KAG6067433.1 hypothetical protein E4U33_005279 [Claviceps sp. LM78 group G4]KAG6071142.1 hypothetical protein E4U16_006336 [Claviceps sp. LM84 group G4]
MKVTLFTLAVAGFAAAQNLDGLPACVKSCIEKGLAQAGCSGTAQEIATCGCKAETQSKLLAPVTQCATENKCNMADLVNAQKVAAVQCQAIAGGAAGKSGMPSGAPSATHNPSAAATSTAAATGAFPTNSANNTKPATSAGTATQSGSSGSSTGSESGSTESGSKGTATGTGAQPTVTNAAAVMGPAAGALVALFAAALAL